MIPPTWVLPLKRFVLPIVSVIAIGVAVWIFGNSRYADGVATEREKWQIEQTKAREKIIEKSAAQEKTKELAQQEGAVKVETITKTEIRYVDRIKEVYRNQPDPICTAADGVQRILAADSD